ncbi:hypothetical protein [Brenneria rubrifaciens]|uniref:hypothetical protein n=1 Tax=Brenneria rubrifaciens TaxID=55213 RepID=UPI001C2F5E97|nr:hypothetical protein [Brenneria rubrifaciens]
MRQSLLPAHCGNTPFHRPAGGTVTLKRQRKVTVSALPQPALVRAASAATVTI